MVILYARVHACFDVIRVATRREMAGCMAPASGVYWPALASKNTRKGEFSGDEIRSSTAAVSIRDSRVPDSYGNATQTILAKALKGNVILHAHEGCEGHSMPVLKEHTGHSFARLESRCACDIVQELSS